MRPEFSHIVKFSELGSDNPKQSVTANDSEREALVKRFDLLAMQELGATYQLKVDGNKVHLSGVIKAALEQPCSISGEALTTPSVPRTMSSTLSQFSSSPP